MSGRLIPFSACIEYFKCVMIVFIKGEFQFSDYLKKLE